jgi:hypothetical protein
MRISYNHNRYKVSQKPVKDINRNIIYENDYCEYTNKKGEIKKGRIKCVFDHDFHFTQFAFISDGRYPVEDCSNIKVLEKGGGTVIATKIEVADILRSELLNCGFTIEECAHGFLVNSKYIVASKEKKWRTKGKNKWYRYKNIESLKNIFTSIL